MALTQDQILKFSQRAKAAGYDDAAIAAEIERKKKELMTPQQPSQPVSRGMDINEPGFATNQTPAPQPEKGGLFSAIKKGGKWIAENLFPATKNFVQDVSSGLTVRSKDYQKMVESNQAAQAQVSKLVERAKTETDPEKKKKLLDLAKQQSASLGQILEEGTPKFSKDVEKSAIERGLAVGTELGTAVVPVAGKGATTTARILSAAKQGAILSGSRAATSLEDMTPEERLKKTLVDAGFGALTVGGLQAGGEVVSKLARGSKATTQTGENIKRLGSEVRQGVRKIREPAGVWSASREDAINKTLDKLNISGTAEQQYTQLEPAYNKLTKAISDFLDDSAKPVVSKDIQSTVQKSLDDIPGDVLAEAQGAKEFEKITKEIAKIKDSKDLFAMKQWLNGRLGRVYTKLEKGNPLSPAEEVLLESRDVIDKTITKVHPEIKELTITQSHLRDAAPSLAKARLVVPTQRVAGTTIPTGLAQRATDKFGKILQGTGTVVEKAGQAGEMGFGFAERPVQTAVKVGQKVLPLTSPSMPFEDVTKPSQDTQGNESQPAQNQNRQTFDGEFNHELSVTQTGYTVEQHLNALSKAIAAGDKPAETQIRKQLAIEQEYQKMTEKKAPKLTAQQKKDQASAVSGLKALDKMEKILNSGKELKDGKFTDLDTSQIWKAAIPGGIGARTYLAARNEASDVLTRLRTGAALNENEERFYRSQLPSPFDTEDDIVYKLNLFRELFNAFANPDSVITDLEQTMGGFSVE